MKKFIAILTAMLIASLPIAVLADNTIAVDQIAVDGSDLTVDFTTNLTGDDQVTLLTYKADSAEAEATAENIKYIDQIDKENTTSIEYALNETPNGTYQVKMGGTEINTPAVMAITIDNNMSEVNYFDGHAINLFKDALTVPDKVTDETGKLLVLKNDKRYVAAYATAPEKEGYTVTEYGVRINGANKSAKVNLTNQKAFGMLFYGTAIVNGAAVTVLPYVIYKNDTTNETITYYGDTAKATLTTTAQ